MNTSFNCPVGALPNQTPDDYATEGSNELRIYSKEGDYLLLIQLCGTETLNDTIYPEPVIASIVALAQSVRNPSFLSQELIIRN